MFDEYDRRVGIIGVLQVGSTPVKISEFLKLAKVTVYQVANDFNASEEVEEGSLTTKRKTHDRSQCSKCNPKFLENLQELIEEDPSISMWIFADRLK